MNLRSAVRRVLADLNRQSYALWYTSNHHSDDHHNNHEALTHGLDYFAPPAGAGQNSGPNSQRRHQQCVAGRSPQARLRADELYMERRKQNVQNYGSSWIKPPGVFKSLHQIREERREMEEHQEALRREQLAHELAEAEAAEELLQGDGDDGDMEEVRDLDDDIPEADTTGIDQDGSSDDEDSDEDDVPRGVLAQRMPDDMFRDALIRGDESHDGFAGEDGLGSDEEDGSQMFQEEDLAHDHGVGNDADLDMDMNMDADLDDDVPEGELGGYEHTDTEEELSSTEDDDSVDMGRLPFGRPLNGTVVRIDDTQNSLDLTNPGPEAAISHGDVSSSAHGIGAGISRFGRNSRQSMG